MGGCLEEEVDLLEDEAPGGGVGGFEVAHVVVDEGLQFVDELHHERSPVEEQAHHYVPRVVPQLLHHQQRTAVRS